MMEGGGESLLDTIYEDDLNIEEEGDIEMVDVEEGELVEEEAKQPHTTITTAEVEVEQLSSVKDVNISKPEGNRKNKKKKRKNKKRNAPSSNVPDVNRFVLDTCRRLKEKKSYMVYTAVGCLGISALSDLVKEVDAIQACGGQMTADGRRYRNGGGVLWSIIKAREPKAYKEIMNKAKEFEKQFRPRSCRQPPDQNKEASQKSSQTSADQITDINIDGSRDMPQMQTHSSEHASAERRSVHERIRLPVTYDDLLGEDPKDD